MTATPDQPTSETNSTQIIERKQFLFDRWAPSYDWLFPSVFYQAAHQQMLEFVTLPNQANILDIGCGTGRLLNRLANHYPNFNGIGVDLSPEMLRKARQTNRHRSRLIFVQGAANPLRFGDEQFDAVFNTFSFMHYPEPNQVFQEVFRVLRPGGQFYLVDPLYFLGQRQPRLSLTPGGIQFYSAIQREAIATEAGFTQSEHHHLMFVSLLSKFTKPVE